MFGTVRAVALFSCSFDTSLFYSNSDVLHLMFVVSIPVPMKEILHLGINLV